VDALNRKLVCRIVSHSSDETMAFGRSCAADLQPGAVITLSGDLGSGKTTLIQGICQGLGVTEIVSSPTFALINEYCGRVPVYHFDFYRMHTPADLHDLGIEEYLYGDGICLIEWPELIAPWLPAGHIRMELAHGSASGVETRKGNPAPSAEFTVDTNVRIIEVYQDARSRD